MFLQLIWEQPQNPKTPKPQNLKTMTKRKFNEIHGMSKSSGQVDSAAVQADLSALESRMAVLFQQIMTQLERNTQRIDSLSQQLDNLSQLLGKMEVKVQVELNKKNWTSCSYIS